jgi:ubiquinone/menaquinone biosynthesis C-methylase UbiE
MTPTTADRPAGHAADLPTAQPLDRLAEPPTDRLFSGLIGEHYALLRVMLPESAEMSCAVGERVAAEPVPLGRPLAVLEIGTGTGITTLALLTACAAVEIAGVDREATMLRQAEASLRTHLDAGRLSLIEGDALATLQDRPTASVDVVASAYTLHNFEDHYRTQCLAEILRVLRPGGLFVNGDRYALDDPIAHTAAIQAEIQGYFQRIAPLGRYDVLEQWICHLFGDEAPFRVMRTGMALARIREMGFVEGTCTRAQGVNALVTARKPPSPPPSSPPSSP